MKRLLKKTAVWLKETDSGSSKWKKCDGGSTSSIRTIDALLRQVAYLKLFGFLLLRFMFQDDVIRIWMFCIHLWFIQIFIHLLQFSWDFFWQISTDHWEQVFETVCRMIGFGQTMRIRFNVKKKVDGLNASIKDRTTLKTSLTIYSKYRPRWFKVLTARVKMVKEINLAELVYIDVECPFISLQQVIFCNIPVFGCYSLLGNKTRKWRQRRKIKDKGLWILM